MHGTGFAIAALPYSLQKTAIVLTACHYRKTRSRVGITQVRDTTGVKRIHYGEKRECPIGVDEALNPTMLVGVNSPI